MTPWQVAKRTFVMLSAIVLPLAAAAAADLPQRSGELSYRVVLPAVACEGCEEPDVPQAPVNARLLIQRCEIDVSCEREESEIHATVTYLWPGGDPSTGFVEEFNAQTCIRVWAEPATLRQTVPGYAFGGNCSTNDSGTTDEFFFTAPGPVSLCVQVDAFIGSTDLGSSNLACVEIAPAVG